MRTPHREAVLAGAAVVVVTLALVAWIAPSPGTASVRGSLSPASTATFPTPIRPVFVVMFENAELGDVMRNGSYERFLAATYAEAGQYYALEHFSLPNYLAVTSGTATNLFKVEKAKNVGDLATAVGETWRADEESMPVPCDSASSGTYDVYHDPWVMYADLANHPVRCAAHVGDFGALNASIASGHFPNYNFVVPNTTNDGHDTNVSVADSWLRGFLAPLLNQSFFRTSVFFLAYDEGTTNLGTNNATGGGHTYFVAVSPFAARGVNSTRQYTDFNVLTTTEWLLGLGHLGKNDNWTLYPPMTDLFAFPPPVHGSPVPAWASGVGGPAPLAGRRP